MNKVILFCIVFLIVCLIYYQTDATPSSPYDIQPILLDQPVEFYKKHREATLRYLIAVYPQGIDSLTQLDDIQLAYFYNSLWFYYNCAYQYTDNDLGSLTGDGKDTTWGSLPCASDYPLPYPPQGIFYNFWTYTKHNIPTIYSDSDENKAYLRLSNFGSGRPGIAGTYKNDKTRCSGIMWVNPRTIQRDIWSPNGIVNRKPNIGETKDDWQIVTNKPMKWSYPDNWQNGFTAYGDNQYIEITHGPSNTGDALNQSPWWWYNICVGSGIFLNLGKTFVSLNKVAAVFDLVTSLAKTDQGTKTLKTFYGSTDPYDICFGIFAACGYNSVTKQSYCDFRYCNCFDACNAVQLGYSNAAGIKLTNFYNEIIIYQQTLGILENIPTPEGIKASIDAARWNTNYRLAHIAVNLLADENCFFMAMNLDLDTLQFTMDPNGSDNYVYELIDLRIPSRFREAAKRRDYSGFMNMSTMVETFGVLEESNTQNPITNTYKEEIIQEYLNNVYEKMWISLRDPLDIYNDEKAISCPGIVQYNVCDGKPAQSMFCQTPLAEAYKCLGLGNEFNGGTCVLSGDHQTC